MLVLEFKDNWKLIAYANIFAQENSFFTNSDNRKYNFGLYIYKTRPYFKCHPNLLKSTYIIPFKRLFLFKPNT